MEKRFHGVVYRYKNALKNDPEFGMSYVGATDKEKTRIKCWRNKGNNYAGKLLADARKRTGWENWDYEALEKVEATSQEELNIKLKEHETYWINHYDSFKNGYNSNIGGTGHKGAKFSKESIKQRTETRKKNGFCHTQATKDHLSKKLSGRKRDPSFGANLSKKLKGRQLTPEHRAAIKAAAKHRPPVSQETREKLRKSHLGLKQKISPEGLAAIDKARVRHPVIVTDTKNKNEEKEYCSKAEAARALGVNVGSIGWAVKAGGLVAKRYRVRMK